MERSVSKRRLLDGSGLEDEGDSEGGWETEEERNREDDLDLEEEGNYDDGSELEEGSDDESFSTLAGLPSHGSPTHLCSHCQYILDIWYQVCEKDWPEFPHYRCFMELRKSAAYGCPICLQFVRSRDMTFLRRVGETGQRLAHEPISPPGVVLLRFSKDHYSLKMKLSSGVILWLELCSMKIFDDCAQRLGQKLPWQRDEVHADVRVGLGDSDREGKEAQTSGTLTIASRWLRTCRKSHGQCRSPSKEFIPTRLISTAADQARLRLSEDFSRTNVPEYATLSHCWGNYAFHTLRRNNLELFRKYPRRRCRKQSVTLSR